MRSCLARSSSRWKVWFKGRAEPRSIRRAVRALVTPSICITRKTSLLPSDLRPNIQRDRDNDCSKTEPNPPAGGPLEHNIHRNMLSVEPEVTKRVDWFVRLYRFVRCIT